MFESRLHAYLRALAGPRACRVGPFLASFDDYDGGLFRNYAIPDDRADPTLAQVTELVEAFLERSRVPRLEYLPGLCPAVEPALLAAGFVPERRLPVMICLPTHAAVRPLAAGIELGLATTDEQLSQVADAQNEAYGQLETTDHDVARLRGTVDGGGLVALARDIATGRGVGGGLVAPPHDGVSELAAIGVRASHRRRGIAAALTALLTRSCPTVGITTPFLTSAGEAEERIYRSAGYQRVTEMIHISVDGGASGTPRDTHGCATGASPASHAGGDDGPGRVDLWGGDRVNCLTGATDEKERSPMADMPTVGLLVTLEAKPGKEAAVEEFLHGGLALVNQEPGTIAWFAIKLGATTYGIFDVFADGAGRDAHLSGRVAEALMAQAPELFAPAPVIDKIDVLATKLPG